MKAKSILVGMAVSFGLFAFVPNENAPSEATHIESVAHVEKVKVSLKESTVNWKGTKVVGGGHEGTISLKSADLSMDHGKIAGGSFVIDMTSINCTDLQGEYKGKLEGHLKADDFFAVEKYPEAKFVIKKVVDGKVTGDLTIRDKTNSISFPAYVKKVGKGYEASAKITFDRSKFDVKYGSDSFFDLAQDKVISNDIVLDVVLKSQK